MSIFDKAASFGNPTLTRLKFRLVTCVHLSCFSFPLSKLVRCLIYFQEHLDHKIIINKSFKLSILRIINGLNQGVVFLIQPLNLGDYMLIKMPSTSPAKIIHWNILRIIRENVIHLSLFAVKEIHLALHVGHKSQGQFYGLLTPKTVNLYDHYSFGELPPFPSNLSNISNQDHATNTSEILLSNIHLYLLRG